jgi:hypothetical protein
MHTKNACGVKVNYSFRKRELAFFVNKVTLLHTGHVPEPPPDDRIRIERKTQLTPEMMERIRMYTLSNVDLGLIRKLLLSVIDCLHICIEINPNNLGV